MRTLRSSKALTLVACLLMALALSLSVGCGKKKSSGGLNKDKASKCAKEAAGSFKDCKGCCKDAGGKYQYSGKVGAMKASCTCTAE